MEHAEYYDYSAQWVDHNDDKILLLVNPNIEFIENIMKRIKPKFVAIYSTLKTTNELIGVFLDSKGLKGNYWYGLITIS